MRTRLTGAMLAVLGGLLTLPAVARAGTPEHGGEAAPRRAPSVYCGFEARPDCPVTLLHDLGFGAGPSLAGAGIDVVRRYFTDVGVLVAVRWGSRVHVGPVLGLGLDSGKATFAWHVNPRVRARWWLGDWSRGGWPWALEGSLGGSVTRVELRDGAARGYKAGIAADVAFSYKAWVGLFIEGEALFDVDVGDGPEMRVVGGLRGSLIMQALTAYWLLRGGWGG
ncbi:MAG TPA: hypothetical protein VG389_20645 [Myxococcota bacterium]|nr:hypothetical protein [Myxococcota bacterium]